MTEGTLRPLPTLCEGRIQLREPLPESGPALLDALDEQGNPCVVEVIPEAPSLKDQLHRLARSTHPGLPILLDTVVLDGRFLVAQHPGPGHPLSQALGPSWTPWSVARVARVLSRLCHGLDLLHRLEGVFPAPLFYFCGVVVILIQGELLGVGKGEQFRQYPPGEPQGADEDIGHGLNSVVLGCRY